MRLLDLLAGGGSWGCGLRMTGFVRLLLLLITNDSYALVIGLMLMPCRSYLRMPLRLVHICNALRESRMEVAATGPSEAERTQSAV